MRVGVALLLAVLLAPVGAAGSTTRAATIVFPTVKPICKPPRMCPVPVVPPPSFSSVCYSSRHATSSGLRVSELADHRWSLSGHFTTASLSVTWRGTTTTHYGAGSGTWHATRRPGACGSAPTDGRLTIAWTQGTNATATAQLRLLAF
jgi:hypothetical protein